jgi:protein-disulfide isomerase
MAMDTNPTPQDLSSESEIAPLYRENPPEDLGRPARRVGRKWLAVGLVAVLVVAAASLGLAVARPWATSSPTATTSSSPVFNPVLGNSAAPVTIDLYEDFQCPICREWGQMVFPQLRDGAIAAGEAKLVFHGLSSLGSESEAAVRAAYAADQQGHFWDMWAALYAHQGTTENSGAFSDANLRAMAQGLGLDLARYDTDFASSAAQAVVSAGKADGKSHAITGTPTLVIAGQQYQGISTYPDLKATIDAAQKSAPSVSASASIK